MRHVTEAAPQPRSDAAETQEPLKARRHSRRRRTTATVRGAAPPEATEAVAHLDSIAEIHDESEGAEAQAKAASQRRQRELRDAVIELRKARATLAQEHDFLIRHIGLRTLSGQTEASGLDPAHLEQPEDQSFVRLLLNTLRKDVHRSFEQLNPRERADLAVLDDCAIAAQALQVAQEQRVLAEQLVVTRKDTAEKAKLALSTARANDGRRIDALARARERSPLTRRLGLALAITCAVALTQLMTHLQWVTQHAAEGLALGAVNLSFLVIGIRLSQNPKVRLQEMLKKFNHLNETVQMAQASLSIAEAESARAQERCARAEADFKRDEAVAIEVAERRPGVVRYVNEVLAISIRERAPVEVAETSAAAEEIEVIHEEAV